MKTIIGYVLAAGGLAWGVHYLLKQTKSATKFLIHKAADHPKIHAFLVKYLKEEKQFLSDFKEGFEEAVDEEAKEDLEVKKEDAK